MLYPHNIFNWILEIVFPHRCVVCRESFDDHYLCKKCLRELPIKRQSECVGCKLAISSGKTCPFCREENSLDQLLIVSDFKDPKVQAVIKSLKYKFIEDLAYPIHELTKRYLLDRAKRGASIVIGDPLLIPIPLHHYREKWRGFNQSELLARFISGTYHLDISLVLERKKLGKPQAEIPDKELRLKNAKDVYCCIAPELVKDRDVLLIDDVCTTGATLNECARVLKSAGAKQVSALVIARG